MSLIMIRPMVQGCDGDFPANIYKTVTVELPRFGHKFHIVPEPFGKDTHVALGLFETGTKAGSDLAHLQAKPIRGRCDDAFNLRERFSIHNILFVLSRSRKP